MFKKSYSILNSYSKRLLSTRNQNGYDWTKVEKALVEPFEYVKSVPYKHYNKLVPTFNHWLQLPKEKHDLMYEFTNDFVAWTILIDDIRDHSQFRNGLPSAHQVFGVSTTINAANIILFTLQMQIMEFGQPSTLKRFMELTKEAFEGEGIDVYWRDQLEFPTEEALIRMTNKKGGAYFAVPVNLMQSLSSNKTDYTDLAINIGTYFQILDDYYNVFHPNAVGRLVETVQVCMVTSISAMENHGFNSDITEGKITLPVIHASQFPDVSDEISDILKQRTSDPKLKNRFVSLLKKHGSDEYVRDKLNKLEIHIRSEIEQHGGNPMLTAFMDDLSFQKHAPAPLETLYS